MDSANNDEIIREEMEALKADIIAQYEAGGKKTSGEFQQGLQIKYSPNQASLEGYVYLAGRKAGKMPPVSAIERWIVQKGISPIEKELKVSSLAYLIARKIAKEGTNKENHQYIYDEIITPERIETILERLNQVNVNWFIGEINIMINKLVTAA